MNFNLHFRQYFTVKSPTEAWINYYYCAGSLLALPDAPNNNLYGLFLRFKNLAAQIKSSGHIEVKTLTTVHSHLWRKHWKLNQDI